MFILVSVCLNQNNEHNKKDLSPQECEASGGRPVNTVGGGSCEDNEKNIGNVVGFISPNICCMPK